MKIHFKSDKFSNLKKEALSSFGRKGVKFNLNKSTSVLSSMSDVSTAQRWQLIYIFFVLFEVKLLKGP